MGASGLMTGFSPLQSYSSLSGDLPYPIISDPKRELAVKFGMLDPEEKDKEGLPLTCRAVSGTALLLHGSLCVCVLCRCSS